MMLLLAVSTTAGELEVGADAPGFSLLDSVDGSYYEFKPTENALSVVVFTCNQCPYAQAFEQRIIDLATSYSKKGVTFVAVNPNDETQYPGEAIAEMRERAVEKGYPFPYLKDTDSSIARAYGARVTPHIFVVDTKGKVRYRGYVDDSAKTSDRGHTGLTDALDSLLDGRDVQRATTKAFGCTIKWKRTS